MRRRAFLAALGGAAFVWPETALAQQSAMPTIGFLSSRSAVDSVSVEEAFRKGLYETGAQLGHNVRIIYRWAEGQFGRLPALAAELVTNRVAVIVAAGGDVAVHAAKAATSIIPIVFITGGDPAITGLVASLNRPGGNVTGVTLFSLVVEEKRFELLRELLPNSQHFSVLLNQADPLYKLKRANAEVSARSLRLKIHVFDANSASEIESAFAQMIQLKTDALLVGTSPFFSGRRNQIMALAMRHGLPAIYDSRIQVAAGALMSYGANYEEVYRQAGLYTGKILKGAQPAELPVLLPTKFELLINLTTAKALGITVPPALLARADEVIE